MDEKVPMRICILCGRQSVSRVVLRSHGITPPQAFVKYSTEKRARVIYEADIIISVISRGLKSGTKAIDREVFRYGA